MKDYCDGVFRKGGIMRKFKIDPEDRSVCLHTIRSPKRVIPRIPHILGGYYYGQGCATGSAFATAFMAMDLGKNKGPLLKPA